MQPILEQQTHRDLKAVCTSVARRDYTTQGGHWQVAISSTQLY